MPYLIAGIGNFGAIYEKTRHNIGRFVLEKFVKDRKFSLVDAPFIQGEVYQKQMGQKNVYSILPNTFVNRSGTAIDRCMKAFSIPLENLLVLADDLYTPFGQCRFTKKGSCGGHRGLENIEDCLLSVQYARLRIGISRPSGKMEEYVLSKFTDKEMTYIPGMILRLHEIIEDWIKEALSAWGGRALVTLF